MVRRWQPLQQWEAILCLEAIAPEKIERLFEIVPNWAQWCDA
jgi:hypothetical protein